MKWLYFPINCICYKVLYPSGVKSCLHKSMIFSNKFDLERKTKQKFDFFFKSILKIIIIIIRMIIRNQKYNESSALIRLWLWLSVSPTTKKYITVAICKLHCLQTYSSSSSSLDSGWLLYLCLVSYLLQWGFCSGLICLGNSDSGSSILNDDHDNHNGSI